MSINLASADFKQSVEHNNQSVEHKNQQEKKQKSDKILLGTVRGAKISLLPDDPEKDFDCVSKESRAFDVEMIEYFRGLAHERNTFSTEYWYVGPIKAYSYIPPNKDGFQVKVYRGKNIVGKNNRGGVITQDVFEDQYVSFRSLIQFFKNESGKASSALLDTCVSIISRNDRLCDRMFRDFQVAEYLLTDPKRGIIRAEENMVAAFICDRSETTFYIENYLNIYSFEDLFFLLMAAIEPYYIHHKRCSFVVRYSGNSLRTRYKNVKRGQREFLDLFMSCTGNQSELIEAVDVSDFKQFYKLLEVSPRMFFKNIHVILAHCAQDPNFLRQFKIDLNNKIKLFIDALDNHHYEALQIEVNPLQEIPLLYAIVEQCPRILTYKQVKTIHKLYKDNSRMMAELDKFKFSKLLSEMTIENDEQSAVTSLRFFYGQCPMEKGRVRLASPLPRPLGRHVLSFLYLNYVQDNPPFEFIDKAIDNALNRTSLLGGRECQRISPS